MNTQLLVAAVALVSSACVTVSGEHAKKTTPLPGAYDKSGDLGFRLDESTCECRNSHGDRGYNPGFVGECGLLGNDTQADPDDAASAPWVDLADADLSNKNLRGALLKGAFLRGANFHHSDLTCADLQWSYLKGARFDGADLRFTTFRRAWLYKVDFTSADLRGAYVDGFAKGLKVSTCTLTNAVTDSTTRLARALETGAASGGFAGRD